MPWAAIIGVVGNASNVELENPAQPFMYATYQQASSFTFFPPQDLVLRTSSDPLNLATAARNEIWAVDKDLPVSRVQTMEQILGQSVSAPRFNMMLLAIFAMLALALAAVGIYGVMSYSITQSTREIGIRMALGAQPADILRLVLGQGLALTLMGVTIGLVGAFALTRLMASLLYGMTATDPLTFASVPALLLITAMLACYVPARRAARVDPMEALRYE